MAKVFKEYPKMLYHESGIYKAVLNREEMIAHLEKGWSTKPVQKSEANELREKIAKTKEELRLMEMKLASIESLSGKDMDFSAVGSIPATAQESEPKESPRAARKPGRAKGK